MKTPQEIIEICTSHYNYWKKKAIDESDPVERKKAIERAFFWLETQTSFLILWAIENSKIEDETVKKRVMKARANLSKKLIEYAENVLKDLE
ncbi:MAG: hypothetical protein J7K98_01285 [Candidatus Aenigmarchaeota archaeon]|nr:hypothetical protein [Candidatus Aenigmarchaeota archaeon]